METSRGMTVVVLMKSEGQDTWCLRVATDMVCLSLGRHCQGQPPLLGSLPSPTLIATLRSPRNECKCSVGLPNEHCRTSPRLHCAYTRHSSINATALCSSNPFVKPCLALRGRRSVRELCEMAFKLWAALSCSAPKIYQFACPHGKHIFFPV